MRCQAAPGNSFGIGTVRWTAHWLTLGAMTASLAGCLSFPTMAERAATFVPHSQTRVDDRSLHDFLLMRTALLARDTDVREIPDSHPKQLVLAPRDDHHPALKFGLAIAIDVRGYFLTAAHCVKGGDQILVSSDGTDVRVFVPRVVWRGDANDKEPDCAILHVGASLPFVFEWADEFEVGEPVATVGASYDRDPPLDVHLSCLGGRILDIGTLASGKFRWIEHATPLHPGDSGGPLATLEGGLIGVNAIGMWRQSWGSFRTAWSGRAVRPDRQRLRQLIQEDWTRVVQAKVEDETSFIHSWRR